MYRFGLIARQLARPADDEPSDDVPHRASIEEVRQLTVVEPGHPQRLCRACSLINLHALFSTLPENDMPIHGNFLSLINEFNRSCPLCCLLLSIKPPWWPTERLQVQAFPSKRCLGPYSIYNSATVYATESQELGHIQGTVLGLGLPRETQEEVFGLVAHPRYMEEIKSCGFICEKPTLRCDTLSLPKGLRARIVDSKEANLALLGDWLQTCSFSHQETCGAKSTSNETPCRVIDCQTRKAIDFSPGFEYIALSYVWGADDSANSMSPAVLEQELEHDTPKTIEDAIVVVTKLGYRYLWVDRYCIRQDDAREKRGQIRIMHSIYLRAVLTIIAAAGTNPKNGLPGVGHCRVPQPKASFGNLTLVSSLSDPQWLVQNTRWYTRGWTFQEAVFSRRRAFFTEQQLIFECNRMLASESLEQVQQLYLAGKLNENTKQAVKCIFGPQGLNSVRISRKSLGIFWEFVEHYTQRDLTIASDVLDAMLSISEAYRTLDPPLNHCWGIPVEPLGFDHLGYSLTNCSPMVSLCWEHVHGYNPVNRPRSGKGGIFRRRGLANEISSFPSWSWVGWEGHARYLFTTEDEPNEDKVHPADEHPTKKIYALKSGEFVDWNELRNPTNMRTNYNEFSRFILIKGLWFNLKFTYMQESPADSRALENKHRFGPGFYASIPVRNDQFFQGKDRKAYAQLNLSVNIEEGDELYCKLQNETWPVLLLYGDNYLWWRGHIIFLVPNLGGPVCERIGIIDFTNFRQHEKPVIEQMGLHVRSILLM